MTEGGRREGQKEKGEDDRGGKARRTEGGDEEDRGRKNGEDGGKELLDEAA